MSKQVPLVQDLVPCQDSLRMWVPLIPQRRRSAGGK